MTLWGTWGFWGFWLAAGGMTVVVASLLVMALIRGRGRAAPTAAYDLQVYRDQLKEVEKDRARGVLSAGEAERLRAEVSRRILDADRALKAGGTAHAAPRGLSWAVGIVSVLACFGAVWMYQDVGAPGYPDMPIAMRIAEAKHLSESRPDQAVAEAEADKARKPQTPDPKVAELLQKLRDTVAQRPDDLMGQELLAQNEARIGNYHAAWKAQAAIIRIKGKQATADDYAQQANLMVIAAGGFVSPQAQAVLDEALKRDPRNGTALFYKGLMLAQTGRPDLGFQIWAPLLETSPPDAPWVAPIREQIGRMATLAGVRYSPPPQPGAMGPTPGQMAAAKNMTPAERKEMIRGMVDQLSSRLHSQGGSGAEWARLIRSYGVLGEPEKAAKAWKDAKAALAGKPEELAKAEAAAKTDGLAE